jgi:hypothetical protein
MVTEDDVPWMLEVGRRRYSSRFDLDSTAGWMRNVVLKSPLLFYPARTENAFAVSMLSCAPWLPAEFEVNLILICADNGAMWDALRLMRNSMEWAKRRKATLWRFCSETDYDLAPLARRLHVTELTPRFVKRL